MQEVERGLAALPAEVVERASSPEAFGSWFLAFRAAPLPCRLRWEGPGLHPRASNEDRARRRVAPDGLAAN